MRGWFACFVCFFVLLVAIASEKDPIKSSSEKLKLWRHVKKLVEYDPPAKVAGGDKDECLLGDDMTGVKASDFNQHKWVMIVSSVAKFPVTCCLFGQQMINYMETVWLASRVLDRGIIEPSFIHQARDDAVYEHMKSSGAFRRQVGVDGVLAYRENASKFHAILGTVPVAGGRLFDLQEWTTKGERGDVVSFAMNKTFWAATGGTIDVLIVGDAKVIGGQACAHAGSCTVHECKTLDYDDGPLPRYIEFFGRLHLVKKVKCLPYTDKDLRGQVYHAALDPADTVVALALHNRHINALTGGSTLSVDLPELFYGTRSHTGQELWSVDEGRQGLQEDWLSILRRFRPADAVTRAMTALLKQTALEKIQNYVGVHWRRGDRGHPEMDAIGRRMWKLSQPEHLSCELNRLLLQSNTSAVFVGTNSGTPGDRQRLRELVFAPLVFLSDMHLFEEWEEGLDALATEMFMLANAKIFLSAGDSHWGSSTISRLVINLRRLPTFAPIDSKYSNADELFKTSNDHPSWRYLSHCDAAEVARKWRKSREQSTGSAGNGAPGAERKGTHLGMSGEDGKNVGSSVGQKEDIENGDESRETVRIEEEWSGGGGLLREKEAREREEGGARSFGVSSSEPLTPIHSNEPETTGGRGGGRGGAAAAAAREQGKAEMRKGWVAWMEEIDCWQDVTVLVGEPLSGRPVTLTMQPQYAESERGGAQENGVSVDVEGSALEVGGVVMVWSWQGCTSCNSCAHKQGLTDEQGATDADCARLREVEETLLLSVKVDGSLVKMDTHVIRKWKCSVETQAYAACAFRLLLPFSAENSGLSVGHHSLTVSVTDGGGAGRTRMERRGGGGTEGYGLWSSPTISFEISAPHSSFFSSSSSFSSDSKWTQHAGSWQSWMLPFYQQVAHQAYVANAADVSMSATCEKRMAGGKQTRDRSGGGEVEQQEELSEANWGQEVGLMGVHVANMPHRRDRLQHTRKLLCETMGFGNISTVRSMPSLSLHDAQRLVSSEGVHACSMRRYARNGVDAVGSAVAHAMSHVQWLQHRAAEHRAVEEPLFQENRTFVGWFEDDLLAASGAAEVRLRIREALAQLPSSADMLYLEASWETCEGVRFNEEKPGIVRAVRLSGSAAIIFTRKGILKAAQILGEQPWHWLDLMYSHAVSVGLLEAYITMPPCFVQDGFFGSDCKRESEMPNVWAGGSSIDGREGGKGGKGKADVKRVHQPVYPVCVEHYFSRFEPFDSLVFTDAHVHTHYDDKTGRIRARSMSIRSPLFQDANEIYFTETHADWQASYQDQGERAKDPLPEISHWGMANGWKPFVQLPLVRVSEECIEFVVPAASLCWPQLPPSPHLKGIGSALGACRVFVMTRDDTPDQSTPVPPATRVIFMVEGDGGGCDGERQEEDIWL